MIEDQVSPKRCGHTRGKQVVGRGEAKMRIRAAVDERAAHEILIMARTDACGVLGYDEALDRCKMFVDEGADIIFLEAPETREEMERFCRAIPRPCMANMVSGGTTPVLPPRELAIVVNTGDDFDHLVAERVWQELQRALVALQEEVSHHV